MIKFGLIGNPVKHSKSPLLFNTMFNNNEMPCVYNLYQLNNISQLPELLSQNLDLVGLNVTSPFKESIIPYLNHLTPQAQQVGAVNTVFIDRKSSINKGKKSNEYRLIGHNTDVAGVIKLLSKFNLNSIQSEYEDKSKPIYVLGTGGASKSVQVALELMKLSYQIISRNKTLRYITYSDLVNYNLEKAVFIDATPLGMGSFINDYPPLPFNRITPDCIGIDLVYSPAITPFLRKMIERGAAVANGLEMLIGQAQESWLFWRDHLSDRLNCYQEAIIKPV